MFLLTGITDCIDGWLARAFHWQSHLGSVLDPLADKLLVAASFISLALLEQLPWWLVMLVFMRDLTISLGFVGWYFYIKTNIKCEPSFISKLNTTIQLTLVITCLVKLAYGFNISYFKELLILLTCITTSITYVHYVWSWSKKAYDSSSA